MPTLATPQEPDRARRRAAAARTDAERQTRIATGLRKLPVPDPIRRQHER